MNIHVVRSATRSNPSPAHHQANARHFCFKKWAGIGLVGLFVLNMILLVVYQNRSYPRSQVGGVGVGNQSFAAIEARDYSGLLHESLTLHDGQAHTATLQPEVLGAQLDKNRLAHSLRAQHSWLPIVAALLKHKIAVPVQLSAAAMATHADKFQPFRESPVNARITFAGQTFAAVPGQDGVEVDQAKFVQALQRTLDNGGQALTVSLKPIAPAKTTAWAKTTAQNLQASLRTKITYSYNGATHELAAADIAGWYRPAGDSFVPDDFAMRTSIFRAGLAMNVHAQNLTDAVAATKTALSNRAAATIALKPFAATKTLTYCVNSRGANAAGELAGLKTKLVSTYEDLRGWSLDGQVIFRYSTANCDFTVWLTDASQMPTFGDICDTYWNCEVNNNVVVNLDRWNVATPNWNTAGGNQEDYRVMLINHETGHMLGFQHLTCPAPGQPAPVMMQQSIALDGCVFNIWPTPAELAILRARLAL